jgi:glycosyltransferase involved in cell wall biosynthesis
LIRALPAGAALRIAGSSGHDPRPPERDVPVFELLGLVALEAMATRTPVVASRIGGLAEVVVDGETGFLVPPDDTKALGDCLARLYRTAA